MAEAAPGRRPDDRRSVGGQKIPPVDHYIAGYRYGVKKANPQATSLNGYSQDFVDQAKCKEIALDEIANGAGVIFQVAGGCGLGALDAAKEKKVQGIGVDADQCYLGSHILTSALKKVDVAVYQTIASARQQTARSAAATTPSSRRRTTASASAVEPEGPGVRSRRPNAGQRRDPAGGQDQAAGDGQELRHSCTQRGRASCPPFAAEPVRNRDCAACCAVAQQPVLELAAASRSASRASSRTTTSTSTCARARCTRCSARTAPASRR